MANKHGRHDVKTSRDLAYQNPQPLCLLLPCHRSLSWTSCNRALLFLLIDRADELADGRPLGGARGHLSKRRDADTAAGRGQAATSQITQSLSSRPSSPAYYPPKNLLVYTSHIALKWFLSGYADNAKTRSKSTGWIFQLYFL